MVSPIYAGEKLTVKATSSGMRGFPRTFGILQMFLSFLLAIGLFEVEHQEKLNIFYVT